MILRWGLTYALALIVGVTSGGTPWKHAVSGAFFAPDFAQDVAAARLVSRGEQPYSRAFQPAHAEVMRVPPPQGYPYFPHPPFVVAVALPFAPLPYRVAAALWFLLSLGLLVLLGGSLAAIWRGADRSLLGPLDRTSWLVSALLLTWPPVLYTLEKGQLTIAVALLVAVGWRAVAGGRWRAGGVCLALAAALKVTPVLLCGYLAFRMRRALAWMLAIGAAVTAVPLATMGAGALLAFVDHSQRNVEYWQTWPAVTYSIHGLFARAFAGGAWAEPWMVQPEIARAATLISGLALIAIVAFHTAKARTGSQREVSFAAWSVLLVVLNPVSMGHNGVILALPIVLIARVLRYGAASLPWLCWSLGAVLVSIPRQAIVEAVPAVVGPVAGVGLIALPMWGALLLLASALLLARPRMDQAAAEDRFRTKPGHPAPTPA